MNSDTFQMSMSMDTSKPDLLSTSDIYSMEESDHLMPHSRAPTPSTKFPQIADLQSIQRMVYLFLYHQDMNVNLAASLFRIRHAYILRYAAQFDIGSSKKKSMKTHRYNFQGHGRVRLDKEFQREWEEKEEQRLSRIVPITEPDPIDPLSLSKMKKVEIRIMFPKIRYGQVHQWDRYYERLTLEVQLKSVQWIDFKEGNKFQGRGSYIYVLSKYDQNVFVDNFALEKFLETSMPEDFFSGNRLKLNKIRVFDYPYIPENHPEEEAVNLKVPKEKIFAVVDEKLKALSEGEFKQLDEIAQKIYRQYLVDAMRASKWWKKETRQKMQEQLESEMQRNEGDVKYPVNDMSLYKSFGRPRKLTNAQKYKKSKISYSEELREKNKDNPHLRDQSWNLFMQEELLSGEEEDKNIKNEDSLQNTPNKEDEKKIRNSEPLLEDNERKKIRNSEAFTQDTQEKGEMNEEIYFPQDGSSQNTEQEASVKLPDIQAPSNANIINSNPQKILFKAIKNSKIVFLRKKPISQGEI